MFYMKYLLIIIINVLENSKKKQFLNSFGLELLKIVNHTK